MAVMNSGYQKNMNRWIVYSTFKSNLYTYGTSQDLVNMDYLLRNNKRKSNHFIGPIRTWRVKLLYNIPIQYHQNSSGHWIDTVYDDAMQHSIVELAGISRVKYIPEMLYEYNKLYGDNDDSTQEKKIHRRATYQWMLGLTPLNKLDSLDKSVRN